jgi:hypothetical protein
MKIFSYILNQKNINKFIEIFKKKKDKFINYTEN